MNKLLSFTILILLLFANVFCCIPIAYAVDNQAGLWAKITLTGHINKNPDYLYFFDIENRSIDNFDNQVGKAELGLGYVLSPSWSAWLGDEYFNKYTVSPTTQANNAFAILAWSSPHLPQKINYTVKTRIEEYKLINSSGMATRLREQLSAGFPLRHTDARFISSEEFFMLLNHPAWVSSNFLEQNRTFLGFDKPVARNTHLEIGYLSNLYWKASNNDTTTNSNNLYVNIVINTDN
jgi:hypothetical protein